MKNPAVLLGLLGLGGLAAYFYFRKNQIANPSTPLAPGNQSVAQPSLLYPYVATQSPRVDNANQPWYNQSQAPMKVAAPALSIQGIAGELQGAGSIVHSLSDVWGSLGLGGNDAETNLIASSDDYPEWDDLDSEDTEYEGTTYDYNSDYDQELSWYA